MNKIQRVLIILLVSVSAITWFVSAQQYDTMMSTMMMFYNLLALLLFTVIWTAGMAAMMFPAIVPLVLFYDRLIKSNSNTGSGNNEALSPSRAEVNASLVVGRDGDEEQERIKKSFTFWSPYSIKMTLFVGSYLLVWALTGIAILIGWSIPMNYFFMQAPASITHNLVYIVFGVLLVISGLYQFSPLKTRCLGYCESPLSFFMRRWSSGAMGAFKMGTYNGLYCLGCCWPYFLLMVALGWMNLLWMGLFAAIIFAEKVWVKGGRWVARSAGVGFVILGISVLAGVMEIPTGGMTMAEIRSNNNDDDKAMEMDNGMNMDMDIEMSMAKLTIFIWQAANLF